ncbi:MAG: tRNA (N(6)-L-threonylcarbamoyladenosine(37)-C(2))-methylthiotransferase MtaB [Clostridia bacterium]|nr:tRNA (N(6)-L-threonylcarbamoyladenosine(37)-C(2))-methylthiotransferase MtaB [Clostridia bacterium]
MRVAFFTLGCKVNQYETDLMMKNFIDNGYEIVDFDQKSDIYIINSCSVTNLSTRKTRQYLSKAKRNGGIVVLAGCYAQEIKGKEDLKNVDIVIGNQEKNDVVQLVEKYITHHRGDHKILYKIGEIGKQKKYIQTNQLEQGVNIRESIKIEDGCNNFCSYCIIPYVRGRVRSRNLNDILDEIKMLVKNGVGEIVLVGIEIASYGKDLEENISLIDVVERVSCIDGLKRIRLGSLEPRILTDDNIIRLSKIKNLCPHFHISVQSLNNHVLKNMNRKYTKEDLFHITDMIRCYFSDVAFTCDIIVGFPGETDDEFKETIENVKKIGFYEVHCFKYSKRKWTRAATMENQVEGKIAQRRSEELISLAKFQKEEYMKSYIGQNIEVLFESFQDGFLYGYTKNYIKVRVRGEKRYVGECINVNIENIDEDLLYGVIK